MNYADFQTYFTRVMWQVGNAEFVQDLPQLIRKAEQRINRDLRQIEQTKELSSTITDSKYPFPADYQEAKALKVNNKVYSRPVTAQLYKTLEEAYKDYSGCGMPIFAVYDGLLHFISNASPTNPVQFWMVYYYKLIPYEDDPAVPFYDKQPDFYEAALKVQCYDYLRDFDLSAECNGVYQKLLEGMELDQARKEFPAGPIYAPLPGVVM